MATEQALRALEQYFIDRSGYYFGFLERDHGYALEGVSRSEHHVAITYRSASMAIRVTFEPREEAIFVYVIQLETGRIPEYLDAPSRWAYLQEVAASSGNALKTRKEVRRATDRSGVEAALSDHAKDLQRWTAEHS